MDKPSHSIVGGSDFFQLSKPLPFSHKRFFLIKFRQVIFYFRTNSPFLSCDSFAREADYIVGGLSGRRRINKMRLKKAKILFVKTHQLEDLLVENGELIFASVILTGNSDFNITEQIKLPESVRVVFAQNCSLVDDTKFMVLPIGLENLRGGRSGLRKFHSKVANHKIYNKVYLPPMAPTNPIRYEVLMEANKNYNNFEIDRYYKSETDYFSNIKNYKFIFCCEGNGFDVHRIWESLYQGSFPVMLDSQWARSLAKLALPILIVKTINEINGELLKSFLQEFESFDPENEEKRWIYYWKTLFSEYL